jgi:hypothetical protein
MPAPHQVNVQPHHCEIPLLSDDMSVRDLIAALEDLPLRKERRCLLQIDRDVRDYLVRVLQDPKRGPSS